MIWVLLGFVGLAVVAACCIIGGGRNPYDV
jgi:hypothetical protein